MFLPKIRKNWLICDNDNTKVKVDFKWWCFVDFSTYWPRSSSSSSCCCCCAVVAVVV